MRFRELESELDGDSTTSRIPSNEKKPRLDYIFSGSSRPYNGQCEVPYPLARRSSLGLTNRPQSEREIRRKYSHDAAVSAEHDVPGRDASYGWYDDSATSYGDEKLGGERVLPLPPSGSTAGGRLMPQTPSTSNVLRSSSMVEPDHQQLDVVDSSGLTTLVRPLSMQGHAGIGNPSPLPLDDQSSWLASTNIIDSSNRPSSHHYSAQPKQLPLVPYTSASNRSKESIVTSVPSDPHDNSGGYASRSYTSNGYHSQQTHHPSSHHTSISKGSSHYDPTFSTASDSRLRGPPVPVRSAFDLLRNDSLSSDHSESYHGSPLHRPVHRTRSKGKKLEYQFSLSSSDEEIRSSLHFSGESYPESFHDDFHKCRRNLKREEILDAKIKKFLAVSTNQFVGTIFLILLLSIASNNMETVA